MTTRLHRCVCGHQNSSHEDENDLMGLCMWCDCEEFRPEPIPSLAKPFEYHGPVGLDAQNISGHRRRSGLAW